MKTRFYILTAIVGAALAGCNLDQLPSGSTITEGQYEQMDNKLEGTVRGVYSKLYEYGGEHDLFGQRGIDLATDILSSDIAMKSQRYGWFVSDEQMLTAYYRRDYVWSYYYDIIRLCNKGINALEVSGIPAADPEAVKTMTDEEYTNGYYYAQLLTMRGWAYAGLQRFFCKTIDEIDINTELSVPIYTEEDTRADTILGAPRSTALDVYLRVEEDLLDAIKYFEVFNALDRGSNKLEVNIDVARMTLAYSYLNKGDYENALNQAEELLGATTAEILPRAEVLTSGFNNKDTKSWIWGLDVTVENTTMLASWFGQCDIYSYSYASAGDVKGIDANLLKQVQDMKWDVREGWWNKYYNANPKADPNYQYAPDGKFYSAASTEPQGDRDWLSDQVYMRVEEAYLIAAEAAWRGNDDVKALERLTDLLQERYKDGQETVLETYLTTLSDHEALGEAIRYNWRVELWGEGRSLQTFRRWGKEVERGDNHMYKSRSSQSPFQAGIITFEIPTAETTYNPYLRQTTELATQQ
ncbi:MAG: RagB/SusD family nutrient uptake outer membrane protein [Paludibacteraceae bacterium]